MGTQSAFWTGKFAILPQQLKLNELVSGNALVEAAPFLRFCLVLLGPGLLRHKKMARNWLHCGSFRSPRYLASRFIPNAVANAPELEFKWQPFKQTKATLAMARAKKNIFRSMLSISWFWFLGAVYLTQFPNFTKLHLKGEETAVALLLALFSIGISLGSFCCERLSKGRIEVGIIPIGSVGLTVFGLLMALAIPDNLPHFSGFSEFALYQPLWPMFAS